MCESYTKSASNCFELVVDSGSTKADWCFVDNGHQTSLFSTQGINPFHQDRQEICRIIKEELFPEVVKGLGSMPCVASVFFYGAGCRGEGTVVMSDILQKIFSDSRVVRVESDLMAAANAVCGKEEGIACILGTGANSCLYDGEKILSNVSPLGYILGDEGSGAVLGKLFLNEMFKGNIPAEIREEYFDTSKLGLDDIIRKVYREPLPNRWLASLSPFIHSHLYCFEIREVVVRNFVDFFRKNVDHYGRHDLQVGAVGSVAYYYRNELFEAASRCGYKIGKVVKSPLDGLI